MLTHLSLFSGIGGIDLAAEWAGFKTICFVEIEPFCQKVLSKHWPNTPIKGDICEFDGTKYQDSITLITGGFPCQPFSVAGSQRGEADDRNLWTEMFRVIQEVRPTWVIGENVTGFIRLGLDTALFDLENEGYSCQPFIIPACAVNAWHRRDRVWIVAYSKSTRQLRAKQLEDNSGCQRGGQESDDFDSQNKIQSGQRWWSVEPDVGRVGHGIPSRMDRLRALGNAVVPQQVYPIVKAIADTYKEV